MISSPGQQAVIQAPLDQKAFVHGPAGCGKSTAGVGRLQHLLSSGVAGDSILLLAPQRTLQEPYLAAVRSAEVPAGTEVAAFTVGGLARRMCELFWPLVADKVGFGQPNRVPFFLTLETSQYYMAHIVRPLLDEGFFESVTIDRNRLYSQILDSLNKSAAVGFPSTEIGARLDEAWTGDPGQRRIYADAQACATKFRQFCLDHNLLDFSLQLEVFWTHLWPDPLVRSYLQGSYRHLLYDNLEEDVPRAHDLIREWLPRFESALLIYDEGAGYRRFLGADVETGWALRESCTSEFSFVDSFIMSDATQHLGASLAASFDPSFHFPLGDGNTQSSGAESKPLEIITSRFLPELIDKVIETIRALVSEASVSPSEIVIIAPYLSDALRFAITKRLQDVGVSWRTHRPSRSLRDEPASQALLTLAALAHPQWNVRPARFDVTRALMLALQTDLVRAQLLCEIVYRLRDFTLTAFEDIRPETQERLTFLMGNRYERLRAWLLAYREAPPVPLDHFFRRIFGEILSQPGFGFHQHLDASRVADSLIESVRKFRLAMEPSFADRNQPEFDLGREYFAVLQDGVLAAQYLESWRPDPSAAVLVAPAYSYLMMNRPAAFQFWLNPGSSGWFQRLDQPLTHTWVLSRGWPRGRQWTFADEEQANVDGMARLVLGLVRRCREKIYLGISNLGESGFEERGPLLAAFQSVLHEQPTSGFSGHA